MSYNLRFSCQMILDLVVKCLRFSCHIILIFFCQIILDLVVKLIINLVVKQY